MKRHERGALFIRIIAIAFLLTVNGIFWHTVLVPKQPVLAVSVLDVGQGDAILIEGPTGVQVLVDGGPDRGVLRTLAAELPLLDRSLDMVVETHPDKDHIAGLISVLERYQVNTILTPGIQHSSVFADAFIEAAQEEPNTLQFLARRGMRIHLGGGAYADVLYPDRDVSQGETNDGSVVIRVVYGKTSFMLTGDLPSTEEDHLIAVDGDGNGLRSTVLKAGHHGSKHSTNDAWLAAVQPEIVAISAGKDNRYGHPAPEMLARVRTEGAHIVSTIDSGTIHFVSDGVTVRQQ